MTTTHTFIVTVTGCDAEQAEQVMGERLLHDEDYGFDYSVNFQKNEPTSPKPPIYEVNLNARSVRAEAFECIEHANDPETARRVHEKIKTMSDAEIGNLISNNTGDHFWNAFDNVRSDVLYDIEQMLPDIDTKENE